MRTAAAVWLRLSHTGIWSLVRAVACVASVGEASIAPAIARPDKRTGTASRRLNPGELAATTAMATAAAIQTARSRDRKAPSAHTAPTAPAARRGHPLHCA